MKKLFAIQLVIISIVAFTNMLTIVKGGAFDFMDVPSNHENIAAIRYLREKQIVMGYNDGTFRPSNKINRAEFTKIIIEAVFSDDAIDTCELESLPKKFVDVAAQDWFANYLCVAKREGIIDGYPDGTFRPNNQISFTEASKIIVSAFGYPASGGSIWYEKFVEVLSKKRAIPLSINYVAKKISRGEMAELIWRIKDNQSNLESMNYRGGRLFKEGKRKEAKVDEVKIVQYISPLFEEKIVDNKEEIESGVLRSDFLASEFELNLITNGSQVVTLNEKFKFDMYDDVERKIILALRMIGTEFFSMPWGKVYDAKALLSLDNAVYQIEQVIKDKASDFPNYEDYSTPSFTKSLPSELGAYVFSSIFDLFNAGEVKYQTKIKECLLANLVPQMCSALVSTDEKNTGNCLFYNYEKPLIIQNSMMFGFYQRNRIDIEAMPINYPGASLSVVAYYVHEFVHDLAKNFSTGRVLQKYYNRIEHCSENYFNFLKNNSPFALKIENGEQNEADYISVYAAGTGNPTVPRYKWGEDAAESVTAYMLVPEYFRERMQGSRALTQKYEYIRDEFFLGVEFENPHQIGVTDYPFPSSIGGGFKDKVKKFVISDIRVKR